MVAGGVGRIDSGRRVHVNHLVGSGGGYPGRNLHGVSLGDRHWLGRVSVYDGFVKVCI